MSLNEKQFSSQNFFNYFFLSNVQTALKKWNYKKNYSLPIIQALGFYIEVFTLIIWTQNEIW